MRPITEGTIHAIARARHRGRTTWVWEVTLTDDAGRECVLSRVTVAVRQVGDRQVGDRNPHASHSDRNPQASHNDRDLPAD
jgi:hypothetical protein